MRATTIHAPGDIRFEDVPDPRIEEPTDAIVKVVAGCICGSDLWPYRGENDVSAGSTIGHECVGVVEEVGSDVSTTKVGDFVIVPFCHCDNTCAHCRAGRAVGVRQPRHHPERPGRVRPGDPGRRQPRRRPTGCPTTTLIPSLLALTDVMATGLARRGRRRRAARATPSSWSATARWASAASWPQPRWAPSA